MSARQLIILAVAAIAAIGALLLIRGMNANSAPEEESAPVAGGYVLVATREIGQGVALSSGDLAWRLFPEESVGEQFVTQEARPEALTELQGAVTRRTFLAGEPVTEGSIVLPDGRGFMAAVLEPGYRAVSVEVDPATAAGGFIQPNDRVDVVLTQKIDVESESGSGEAIRSSIILTDVRVLALDEHTQPQTSGDGPQRLEPTVAVLELNQGDARRLAQADMAGDISLALRSVAQETGPAPSSAQGGADDTGGILFHTFGRVMGGSR